MDERRRLQGLTGLFVRQSLGGQPAQFVIDQRQQLLCRIRVALLDGGQDLRDVAHDSHLAEKGRGLLKQVRTELIETAGPNMEAMVRDVTGVKVLSMHHDISTVTGEEIVVFTLARTPDVRETKS